MRIYLNTLTTFAILILLLATSPSRSATVDLKALAENAAKTADKFKNTPASWDASNTLGSGAVIRVSVLRAGDKERAVFTLEHGGQSVEMFRIISREGFWYVTDRAGLHKYRPYEAPAESPWIYVCLDRSNPMFAVDPAKQFPANKIDQVQDNIATFREPVAPAALRQLQGVVDQMNAFVSQSGHPLSPELQKTCDLARDVIANGQPIRVDLSTGQVLELGTQKLRTRFNQFQFVDHVDDREFAVADQNWEDNSEDPTAGNLDDLVMIAHQPGIQVGDKNYDLDGRLMDVKTGRFRRIPFPGGVVMPGCFLQDRRSVIVCGLDADTGSLSPYRIDLKTRDCVPIGRPLLASGFTVGGDLSPDGKTVAVVNVDPASRELLHFQVCLIDLASGNARPLGNPIDTAGANWTADGHHLVLLHRTMKDLNSPPTLSLAIMDMDGTVTDLRGGDAPILLADRQTILFQDTDTQLWQTCDLRGGNVNLFADGLKGYGFPSPAPDGKRLLMMHFAPNSLPVPTILKIGDSQGQVITQAGGLWGMPAWR